MPAVIRTCFLFSICIVRPVTAIGLSKRLLTCRNARMPSCHGRIEVSWRTLCDKLTDHIGAEITLYRRSFDACFWWTTCSRIIAARCVTSIWLGNAHAGGSRVRILSDPNISLRLELRMVDGSIHAQGARRRQMARKKRAPTCVVCFGTRSFFFEIVLVNSRNSAINLPVVEGPV